MKPEAPTGPKIAPMLGKKIAATLPSDINQKQRLFADALTKADARSLNLRKRIADDQPVGVATTVAPAFASPLPAATPATASTDATVAAHIERIAAAIAEITASRATGEFHLQLPPGATRLDGAVIGRDAVGAIHIILTTPADIPPATAAHYQSQLTERLLRRDVKIAKIALQRINRRLSDA